MIPGLLLIFLHSCETKSESCLGTRLIYLMQFISVPVMIIIIMIEQFSVQCLTFIFFSFKVFRVCNYYTSLVPRPRPAFRCFQYGLGVRLPAYWKIPKAVTYKLVVTILFILFIPLNVCLFSTEARFLFNVCPYL